MATLEELRADLDSARDLHGIVTTMQALAAVNLRQFQAVAESLAEFRRALDLGLQIVLRETGVGRPELHAADGARLIAVVLGSDQGMVGPFNERIADHAERRLRELAPGPRQLLAMGERARVALLARDLGVHATVAVPASPAGIADTVREMVLTVDRWREDGAGELWLLHHRPGDGASYGPHDLRLLPPDPDWVRGLRDAHWPSRRLPGLLGDPGALLAALVRRHLESLLHLAVAESVAAENAARIGSMQSAERNIEERVEDLEQAVRRRRQEDITEELLDIVAGFEALSGRRGGA